MRQKTENHLILNYVLEESEERQIGDENQLKDSKHYRLKSSCSRKQSVWKQCILHPQMVAYING